MTNPNTKLSEEEFVKSIHSGALAAPSGVDGGLWVIYDPDNGGIIYGSDYKGEREAWADAASRLRAEEGIGEVVSSQPQRQARIICDDTGCGEWNCDDCHPETKFPKSVESKGGLRPLRQCPKCGLGMPDSHICRHEHKFDQQNYLGDIVCVCGETPDGFMFPENHLVADEKPIADEGKLPTIEESDAAMDSYLRDVGDMKAGKPTESARDMRQVRPEIYGNPIYLAGLLRRIKSAYFDKEWKAVERLFEAEIEEMENRIPLASSTPVSAPQETAQEAWNRHKRKNPDFYSEANRDLFEAGWNAAKSVSQEETKK